MTGTHPHILLGKNILGGPGGKAPRPVGRVSVRKFTQNNFTHNETQTHG